MIEERLKKIGQVKAKAMQYDFDSIYEKYKEKADKLGYEGELEFIKEHGNVLIYIKLFDILE